ncbi:MAG: hypothetical protein ABSH34_27610 [Verrucomicrobiota bacterium]
MNESPDSNGAARKAKPPSATRTLWEKRFRRARNTAWPIGRHKSVKNLRKPNMDFFGLADRPIGDTAVLLGVGRRYRVAAKAAGLFAAAFLPATRILHLCGPLSIEELLRARSSKGRPSRSEDGLDHTLDDLCCKTTRLPGRPSPVCSPRHAGRQQLRRMTTKRNAVLEDAASCILVHPISPSCAQLRARQEGPRLAETAGHMNSENEHHQRHRERISLTNLSIQPNR